MKKGDIISLSISDLAFEGAGVGKIPMPEGGNFVVFVERTMPGDIVSARFTKIKKQYGEAVLVSIDTPSPQRIKPRCKHFGTCGGCTLQFWKYEDQLQWKQKIVGDSLRKIGGFEGLNIEPIIGCDSPWFYRNKMEYSFAAVPKGAIQPGLPTSRQAHGDVILGLHERKSFRFIFDLKECFLQSPLSVEIVCAVREWVKEQKVGDEVLKNLVVREGKNTGETMVNLVAAVRDFPLDKAFSEFITAGFPHVTSLYRTAVVVRKGFRTVIEEFHLAGKKTLTEKLTVHGTTLIFEITPQAFFQPNTLQAEALYGKVLEYAQPQASDTVLDLFCGTGTIGMFFAKSAAHVTGVEINASAIESARKNAELNSIQNIDFVCSDISKYQLLPVASSPLPSILITDPPRAGINPRDLEKILALKIPKWIYVSCNPATLARDLKIVCTAGYKLQKIQPVDMFPQTYHVETVVLLSIF